MSYQQRLYEDHGLKPGREVIRISCTRDGKPWTRLFLYDTAASITADWELRGAPDVKREQIAWDGVEHVSTYNGD